MAFSSIEPWRRYRATERKANGRNPRFVKLRGLNPDRPVVCISTSYRFVSKVATERSMLLHCCAGQRHPNRSFSRSTSRRDFPDNSRSFGHCLLSDWGVAQPHTSTFDSLLGIYSRIESFHHPVTQPNIPQMVGRVSNFLAMLVRRDSETLAQLLTRLDLAVGLAFAEDIFTDEVNAPPRKK
jgi:hypothetical protein